MAYVIILDVSTTSVVQYETPDNLNSEEIENWIEENTYHHLSNCSYMCSDDIMEMEDG